MTTTRSFLLILAVSAGLFGCGNSSETPSELQALEVKRDSLHALAMSLQLEIREVELQIAELNPQADFTVVTAIEVESGAFEHFFEAYGEVEAKKNIVINAETMGAVKRIVAREGQRVAKGDVLLELDSDQILSNRDELVTQLDLARDVFQRQERLWQKEIGSEMQYLEAKARLESLEKSLEALDAQVNKSTIRAPFAGTVDEIFPKNGEFVGMGSPVLRLVNLDRVSVVAEISEVYVGQLSNQTPVVASFPSLDTAFELNVSRIANYINPNNRSFKIEVDLPQTRVPLKPNLLAVLKVKDYSAEEVVTIPSRMIQEDLSGRSYVYVLTGDANKKTMTTERRYLESGRAYKGLTEIKQGLRAGDMVVDRGSRSVKDQQEVIVKKD
jgi:RND family efflux transporter MFP subunit